MVPFRKPTVVERVFNKLFGVLAGCGFGLAHNYRLTVRGRKSGREYHTPVNVLQFDGRNYLVAPRGETAWVKNARAHREVSLKRGADIAQYEIHEVPADERVPILREYLTRYTSTVQRYFPVTPTSPKEDFQSIADSYPVFTLEKKD